MIRAVLDTNVLVSAALTGGLPERILCCAGVHFTHVTSPYVLDEFRRVCVVKLCLNVADVDRAIALIAESADVLPVFSSTRVWCGDPADDAIVETAVAGSAEYLVTGDGQLLAATFDIVTAIPPARFAALVGCS